MNWGFSIALYLLLILPLLMFFLFRAVRKRKWRFVRFATLRLFSFFYQDFSSFHWFLKNFLLLLAIFFLIISIARPQWDRELSEATKQGQDVVICLDVSKSMDANDIEPSRLERAKAQISMFIDQMKDDRIAIVAFAGKSFIQCPLTDDYPAAKMLLNQLTTNSIPAYGTNIGSALEAASELFEKGSSRKTIVLISDGEDLEADGIHKAKKIADAQTSIYTLGVGSPEGSPIPVSTQFGDTEYAKDDNGDIVVSKLDISTLSEIASVGNGKFFIISPKQTEIFQILKDINGYEKKKYASKQYLRYKEQYRFFAIFALLILLVEPIIQYRKSKIKSFL